jgi:hypothetical protein
MARLAGVLMVFMAAFLAAGALTVAAQSDVPSVPRFTLKLTDNIVGGGIETEIVNQPILENGHRTADIFYDCRYKWHEQAEWYNYEPDPEKWTRQYLGQIDSGGGVTRLTSSSNGYYEILGSTTTRKLDVQYRAINGYSKSEVASAPMFGYTPGDNPVIVVSMSDWSETTSITLPEYHPEVSNLPTSPTQIPSDDPSSTVTGTPSALTNGGTHAPIEIKLSSFWVAIIAALVIFLVAALIALVFVFVVIYKRLPKIGKK